MSPVDLVFGAHFAAAVGSAAVALAFRRSVCRFARGGLFGHNYADRLGAGVGVIAAASATVNLMRVAGLILGAPLFDRLVPLPVVIAIGLGFGQLGYYLAFTAWLASTQGAQIRRVAFIWAAFLGTIALVGAIMYPFVKP